MTESLTKSALRRELKARRAEIPIDEAASAAFRIGAQLQESLTAYRSVAGFSATQNEVDLTHFYNELLARDVSLYFPRVTAPGEMEFARVTSLDELQAGAFGIPEPIGTASPLRDVEAFLVPGLGFDRQGTRLGFGGGYYDRALGQRLEAGGLVPLFVGIGYSCQLLETVLPVEPWDVRLHLLVTEDGAIEVAP